MSEQYDPVAGVVVPDVAYSGPHPQRRIEPTGRKSLMHPKFRYYSSADTDLRRTFARVRREQHKARVEQQGREAQASKGESARVIRPAAFGAAD